MEQMTAKSIIIITFVDFLNMYVIHFISKL